MANPNASNVMVLYAKNPSQVMQFMTCMGHIFVEEQHGSGPKHWSTEYKGFVLEIYPTRLNDIAQPGIEEIQFL